MPNFLSWHTDPQTQQFGALVQLNAKTFKPQLDGTVQVVPTPRTEFFTGEKISQMAEVAGPQSRSFWQDMAELYPKQAMLRENISDISGTARPSQAPSLAPKPSFDQTFG